LRRLPAQVWAPSASVSTDALSHLLVDPLGDALVQSRDEAVDGGWTTAAAAPLGQWRV
jgi:hypothetical protein